MIADYRDAVTAKQLIYIHSASKCAPTSAAAPRCTPLQCCPLTALSPWPPSGNGGKLSLEETWIPRYFETKMKFREFEVTGIME